MKFILPLLLLILASCGQDITSGLLSSESSSSASTSSCSCGESSDPVCGYSSGTYVTFDNSCLAQCAGYSFTSGECSSESCDSSGEVCGEISSGLSYRVYSSECALIKAGATQVDDDECGL